MIRRLTILLLIVGCDKNSTEPQSCADGVEYNTDSFVGTYIHSSYTEYQTSDCTGQAEEINILEVWEANSITLFLESTGIATTTHIKSNDTLSNTLSWTYNCNEVTITTDDMGVTSPCEPNGCDEDNEDMENDYVPPLFIFSDDTLTIQSINRDDGNCYIQVFTKIN